MIERDKEYYNKKISELYAVIENQEKIIRDYQEEKQELKKDLKTLWIALWNNDTEMTSKQSEIFDKYYDEFHKR